MISKTATRGDAGYGFLVFARPTGRILDAQADQGLDQRLIGLMDGGKVLTGLLA